MSSLVTGTVALAADQPLAVFAAEERLARDWPRTLLTYQKEFAAGAAHAEALRLVDSGGNQRRFQLWNVKKHPEGSLASARVSFFSDLPKGTSYRFELLKGQSAAAANSLTVTTNNDFTTLENGRVAIRLPRIGEVKFASPLPMTKDHAAMLAAYGQQFAKGIAPGPFQGLRMADGSWVGGSYFWAANPESAPRLEGHTCAITEQGPLFVEARVRYAFTGGGWYEFTARVLSDDPAVRIDEQFDTGLPGSMWDYRLVVSLTDAWKDRGWRPDSTYWISAADRLKGRDERFQKAIRDSSLTNATDYGSTAISYDEPSRKLFDVAVRYPWHPNAYFFGLVRTADLAAERLASGKAPFLAVVPMHTGNWRGSSENMDATLFSYAAGDVCLNWPLRANPHPKTMLHTGEYDPALPLTFCRRQWALIGGPFQPFPQLWTFRAQEGYVTLDDYKEWVLDWPADPKVDFPRLLFTRAEVERLEPNLDRLPDGATFREYLYVNDTDKRREELWKKLTSDYEWSSPFGQVRSVLSQGDPSNIPWAIGYRMSQMAAWANEVDELLSSPKLSPERRRRIRTDVAAVCYALTEPDVNPRGSMTHLGNPNMPINRFCALAWAAALIPDHPMAKTWLDLSTQYLRYKLAMNTAPGGTWGELLTYFAASAPHLMQTASVLARAGHLDESTARLAVMPAQFTEYLLSPRDPRFAARILPGWGHEGLEQGIHFLVAANTIRHLDLPLAKSLVWSWDAFGRPMNGHHDAGFSPRAQANADLLSDLPAGYIPAQLQSAWLPGFGVTMRSQAGSSNEAQFSLRQGCSISHGDENQGDFTFYAKGAPLVPLSVFAYAVHDQGPFPELHRSFGWHSRVRFGSVTNIGGWPGGGAVGGVPAHAFSDSADYARAIGGYGPQRWTRQVAFMKARVQSGPTYVVLRDSFAPVAGSDQTALERKWWYLRTLGSKDQVRTTARGLSYTSAFGPKLDVRMLQPEQVQAETRDATRQGPLYAVTARNWVRAGSPTVEANSPESITVRDTMSITAFGPIPPKQDVLVALYPHGPDEPLPRYENLAEGATRITTPESTDTVFLATRSIKYTDADIAFEGLAGVVRLFADEVHLVICEGPGVVSYQGTTLRSELPAAKVIKRSDLAAKKTFEMAADWKLASTNLPAGCRLEGPARCELNLTEDRILGRSEGRGGFLHVPMPPGMKVLPMMVVDGQTYAPGTSGDTVILPLLPGDHTFEVRGLEQPPVFRNWQAW